MMKYVWIVVVLAALGVLWWKKDWVKGLFEKKEEPEEPEKPNEKPAEKPNEKAITEIACSKQQEVIAHRFKLSIADVETRMVVEQENKRNASIEKLRRLFEDSLKKANAKGFFQGIDEKGEKVIFWVEKRAGVFIEVGLKTLKLNFEKDCWDSMPFVGL